MPAPFQFRGNGPPRDHFPRDQGRHPRRDHGKGGQRDRRPRSRPEFTFRVPRPTSDRPLLSSKRETTPEQLLAVEAGEKPAPKFASLDALSDSEEAEMDFSEDSEEERRPHKKRALGLDGNDTPQPVPAPTPKWSNPDPYTVLPPPDETQHKKIDMIKLIRKARLANANLPKKNDAVVQNEDFISLGGLDGSRDDDPSEEDLARKAPENAPKGPKAMDKGAVAAGKRPRDDEPSRFSTKPGIPQPKFNADASVLYDWKPSSKQDPTPWMSSVNSVMSLSSRLHNEIIAFYNWVKPHRFEQAVRADLVSRLDKGFRRRYKDVQVLPFGSFASGLYLPVADMDLVLLSTAFQDYGHRGFGERKGQIYALAAYVRDMGIAVPNSIETIAHARVPILKFVDNLTGLRVDLSFDNDSGLRANRTFVEWKQQYPEMPVIVSVIKQFLLIRGLNEVPTGGLGGFSITCLVTSLLQHMPKVQNQNMAGILQEFFRFYGNDFNWRDTGIRMNPPGFINKYFGNRDRLMIEDPNNPANDISGGTRKILLIFQSFSNAHKALSDRMEALCQNQDDTGSILKVIIGGNFDDYTEQRQRLYGVFTSAPQFAQYREVPPPPPSSAPVSPPPPPPPQA